MLVQLRVLRMSARVIYFFLDIINFLCGTIVNTNNYTIFIKIIIYVLTDIENNSKLVMFSMSQCSRNIRAFTMLVFFCMYRQVPVENTMNFITIFFTFTEFARFFRFENDSIRNIILINTITRFNHYFTFGRHNKSHLVAPVVPVTSPKKQLSIKRPNQFE